MQKSKRGEAQQQPTFEVEANNDLNLTPGQFLGDSPDGYQRDDSQLPDNSEILDIKNVAFEFRKNVN